MTALTADSAPTAPSRRAVGWWLFVVALLVAGMVTLGGVTRLTGSGLSITEWHPVTGVIPPLSEHAWQAEFAKYRGIPQYRLENRGMSLAEFQSIYWWEWTHRLFARIVGAAFLLPFLWFAATGAIARRDWPRMFVLFALGGVQGFVGWWMVESGLETRVSVSQYRLAVHLGVAIVLFGTLLWSALEYLRGISDSRSDFHKRARGHAKTLAWALVGLVYVQMLLGALVAGLHAGLIYNTWPSMNGQMFPEGAFVFRPWVRNFFDNPGLAQFDHRMFAYFVGAAVASFWLIVRRDRPEGQWRRSSNTLLAVVCAQILLGIATLLNQAPLGFAAFHQALAVALFGTAVWNAFELSRSRAVYSVAASA